ncbi:hypothetical protein ACFL21_05150 [Patescibacteria group bacterium]
MKIQKKSLILSIVLTVLVLNACKNLEFLSDQSSTNNSEIPSSISNPSIPPPQTYKSEDQVFNKFSSLEIPGFMPSPDYQPFRETGDLRLYFIPGIPSDPKLTIPYNYLNIWVRPCNDFCVNLDDLDTFRQFVTNEFTTNVVNILPLKYPNVYYHIEATAQSKEPFKEFITAFEYENHYIRIVLGEMYAIPEGTLYDEEITAIATPLMEHILEFLNQE